jgi:hypothetical protein
MFTNLLGKPPGHGSTACTHFEAPPSWLDQGAPLTGQRVEDCFKKAEPLILDFLTAL